MIIINTGLFKLVKILTERRKNKINKVFKKGFFLLVTFGIMGSMFIFGGLIASAVTPMNLTASPTSSNYGNSVTFTANNLNGASGNVTFKDNTVTLGTSIISNGNAIYSTSSLTVGTHTITAICGNSTATASYTVNKADINSFSLNSSICPSTYGQPVTLRRQVYPQAQTART